jgi:succinate-semialdehyde dehydrogenase / glutarate-semialdehyde dehydrogenase
VKVRNPRTGKTDYSIEPLTAGQLADVAARARAAQPAWAALGAEGRADALRALADAMEAHAAAVGEALIADTGRAAISRLEVASMAGTCRRWAAQAPALIAEQEARRIPAAFPTVEVGLRLVPYPLVGVISPWNFPLTLALIDALPALAAGCAVIVKPSEVTPRFIRPFLKAVAEVPALEGVFHIVEGDGATGAALVGLVDHLCFTGSVATGRRVAEAAARAFIPASLELGGKDPMLVLDGVDPDWAAMVALRASIVNSGQACQSIERVYVASGLHDAFLASLVRQAAAVRLNWPDVSAGDIGPFISAAQADIVEAQLADALAKGATGLTGGTIETLGGGRYLRPTVLTGLTPDMAVMREETFGPVIPVVPFDSLDEAVALANSGQFGLSAAILAPTTAEGEALAPRLKAGAVSVNDGALTSMVWEGEKSSFGLSGLGPSRMGASGLLRFFRRQALLVQQGRAAPIAAYAEDARR